MNYANIKYNDIANGPGVRTSLFVSGCRHHCPGCFNQEAWDFTAGQPWDTSTENKVLDSLRPAWIDGLSLLGGEPMEPQNQSALLQLLRRLRQELPDRTVWCYSGFTLQQLTGEGCRCRTEITDELLSLIDVLVDGPFILAEKDISLRFRGSRNQRLLDLKQTLSQGTPVLWEDDPLFANHAMPKRSDWDRRTDPTDP